jgi:hypothetical protein
MAYQDFLQKIEEQVTVFYRDHSDADLFYHNRSRTKELLEIGKRIADHYRLDERSFFIVYAAASFLYSGFHQAGEKTHEAKSAELAEVFLQLKGIDGETITEVKNCILATEPSQKPVTLLEKILCDANTYYLGTTSFLDKIKLLRKEKETLSGAKIDGTTWRNSMISMLETHRYHTDLCELLLNQTKAANLAALENRREEKINKAKAAAEQAALVTEETVADIPGQKQNDPAPKIVQKTKAARGVDTLFRISSTNNIRMSIMADRKAHIMISVNSIIISVTLGLVIKNLADNRHLLIPAILLLAVSVTSIIYAILATRPKAQMGKFTHDQLERKSANLFFFGNFFNMSYAEYEEGVRAMMSDREFLYNSLTKDLYWQGKVLGRKYQLLNICYTVFMYGIIVSVLAFTIAAVFYK